MDKGKSLHDTVWKFHNFSITQILREINFWDSMSAKSAIFTQLEALISLCMNFCTFRKLKSTKLTKFRASKIDKNDILELLGSQNMISRKM